ncbi:MAG: hypothetical protein Q8K57_13470 [Thiobacillus sp.]|nr:hypothetical protein [Thiobacillus sp.]
MADSTTKLTQLTTAQAGKETTVNELMAALSIGSPLARRQSSSGLSWDYYGIDRWHINATATTKANTSLTLTASSTRYVAADRALAVTDNATAFPANKLALYKVVTGTATVTSHEDHRDLHHINRFLYGRFVQAMADANQTLTYQQAMCESMELTGALTALRDVIVPLVPRSWTVYANTTGGFGVRIIGASGAGITVADGKRAIVECDGTNVVRVTADV